MTRRAKPYIVAILFSIMVLFVCQAQAQIVGDPVVTLGINTYSATGGLVLEDSRPLSLRFDFTPIVDQEVLEQCGISANESPLYYIEYEVFGEAEEDPFFSDQIDLYGLKAPGSLFVTPGINLSLNSFEGYVSQLGIRIPFISSSREVVIRTRIAFGSLRRTGENPCSVEWVEDEKSTDFVRQVVPVTSNPRDFVYQRMRDGYARRHIVAPGRGLSWMWLKEFEPDAYPRDRKELLYHSRVMVGPDGKSRVYVPWIYECKDKACGSSVAENSHAVFGANENPLLRGGLAMVASALEYLSTQNSESLHHALRLLDYVEASEWIDEDGNRTGFFLRSRWPTHIDPDTGEPKIIEHGKLFASTDEIVGMSLGLLYLDDALELAGDTVNRQRLEGLVDRLGNQLKNNHYFLLPPSGLPRERHVGWSGTYPLQWFLAGGFRHITGGNYAPSSRLQINDPFWLNVRNFTDWQGEEGDDDVDDVELLLALDLTPAERAITAPIGIGFAMYYGGQEYDLQIDCLPSSLTGPIDIPKQPRFNLPMLLHVFQLGMADADNRDPDVVRDVKENMAVVITGILRNGDDYTREVDLLTLLNGGSGVFGLARASLLSALLPFKPFCSFKVAANVGTATEDDDLYAAAIAQAYGLDHWLVVEVQNQIDVIQSKIAKKDREIDDLIEDLNDYTIWPIPDYPTICIGSLFDPVIATLCGAIASADLALQALIASLEPLSLILADRQDISEDLEWGIARTLLGSSYKFVESLPVGERQCLFLQGDQKCSDYPEDSEARAQCNRCELSDQISIDQYDGIVAAHNPYGRIGQAFLWEHNPKNGSFSGATQDGGSNGGGGLFDDQIIEKYENGVDVMREGAGLGFLLPQILANRDEVRRGQEPIEFFEGVPGVPHFGACFTNSRILGQVHYWDGIHPEIGDAPCVFSFVTLPEDNFDSNARNDTPLESTVLDWGSYPNLNIDHETHPAYRQVEYAKFVGQDGQVNLPPEGDYDYFRVENELRVEAEVSINWDESGLVNLFVDGQKGIAECADLSPPPCEVGGKAMIVVPGLQIHTIKVQAPQTITYSLTLRRPDRDGDGIPNEFDSCPDENPGELDVNVDGCTDSLSDVGNTLHDKATEDFSEAIDEILGSGDIPDSAAADIQKALDKLIGNNDGEANNGAADKLRDGDLLAALVQIRAALNSLHHAAAQGAETDALEKSIMQFARISVLVAIDETAEASGEASVEAARKLGLLADELLDAGDFLPALELYIDAAQALPM